MDLTIAIIFYRSISDQRQQEEGSEIQEDACSSQQLKTAQLIDPRSISDRLFELLVFRPQKETILLLRLTLFFFIYLLVLLLLLLHHLSRSSLLCRLFIVIAIR